MKLSDYIDETGIPAAVLGRRVGVRCRATFWHYVRGKRRPPEEVIEALFRETGGRVRPIDFEWPRARKRRAMAQADASA